MMELGNILALSSAWEAKLGRTHVLIVHFPIALLMVGGAVEFWSALRRKASLSPVGVTCIILGAVSAALASAAGYVHAAFSSFGAESRTTLLAHQSFGIVTAGLALLALLPLIFHREARRSPLRIYRAGAIAAALLVIVTGHFGGTLTHGSGYLTELIFAPAERLSNNHASVVPASIDISRVHF